MPQKLKDGILSLIDEREEVYFLLLVIVLSVALFHAEKLTGTEYIAGVVLLYSALLVGKAQK